MPNAGFILKNKQINRCVPKKRKTRSVTERVSFVPEGA